MKNLKHNHTYPGILFLLLIAFSFSCTRNFKELNTDPNALGADDVNRDNLSLGGFFRQMEESIFPVGGTGSSATNAYQVIQNLCGDIFGGYHGMTHNWNTAGDNTTYNFSIGWNAAAFNSFYSNIVKSYDTISTYNAKFPDILAVAKIIKVEAAHRIVDMYGPIPYFNTAFQLGALGSTYDPMDSIYYSFFKDLDTAIASLKTAIAVAANPLKNFDAVYRGDYTQWVKFANSLKLRLAMRIVYANPARARQYAEEAVNDAIGVITVNADNATMQGTAGTTYNNPLSGLTNDYKEARMSANMESFLKGYNDPRMPALFNPSTFAGDPGNTYRGIRSGNVITTANETRYQTYSLLKTNFNVIWMSSAEVYFLRAEGAVRGWNMGGTAQALYETGITRSFDQWKVSGAGAYIADATSKAAAYTDPINGGNNITAAGTAAGNTLSTVTIKWNEADIVETKLERILTQKWIAVYPDGQEAWSEYRRTGYPKLFGIMRNLGNDSRLSTGYPVKRLPYPASEYQQNGANVTKGVQLLGGPDLGGTKLWWDKK